MMAIPAPSSSVISYCGYLSSQGEMNIYITIIVSTLGMIIGTTISFFIGNKLEHKIAFIHKKLEKISIWFDKYGYKFLLIAYYVMGVRLFIGYFSGLTNLSYKKFAVYSYTGALIYCSIFAYLGYVFGDNQYLVIDFFKHYYIEIIVVSVVVVVIFFILNKFIFKLNIFKKNNA